MFLEFASWLHKTPISVALQVRSPWLWPTCEAIHFAGLALLLGVAGMFDLRLMGFMPRVPIRVIKGFMPWAMFGFTLNVLTGIIFVVSEPAQYFGNPTWWLKVAFLIVAGANALVFETRFKKLFLLPSDQSLRNLILTFARIGSPHRLAQQAKFLAASFDRVIMDCPPGLNAASEQIIAAADLLVVPLSATCLKTGTLDKARSLSGYVTTADGHLVLFSLLCNSFTVPTDRKSTRLNSSHIPLSRMPSSA